MSTKGATYRADVDGLRAVAVLAVVLFHLKIGGFGGGFVGVDVFFVISGYLITGLVQAELEKGTFTIRNFYLRRVRRLLPALVAMSIPVAVAAMILLYPEDMRSYAASLAAQFVSLQNVWFLVDGEYFREADTKFLLHTWSLAVEEQFYLFWPLVLLLSRKWRGGARLALFVAIIVGSFLVNLAFMRISPKASFFLLPSRAWELGAGGVLALLERRGAFAKLGTGPRNVMGWAGLGAIVASVALFSATTPFPGKAALLPVFGSVLVILAGIGAEPTFVTRQLAQPPLVRVGLISYPIYLWHWPLMVICLRLDRTPSHPAAALTIIALTFLLSELTYRFLETPIRDRKWLPSPRQLLIAVAACVVPLTALGIHSFVTNGAPYRFAEPGRSFLVAPFDASIERCGNVFRVLHPGANVCTLRAEPGAKRRLLIWGNSHADMWTKTLLDLAAQEHTDILLNVKNCRATPDIDFCGKHVQDAVFASIATEHVTDVFLASSWYGQYDVPDEVFERELRKVVQTLAERKVRTWLVVDAPTGKQLDPVACFRANPKRPPFGVVPLSEFEPRRAKERAFFDTLAREFDGVHVIDPSQSLCDTTGCPSGRGNEVWYRDLDHVTVTGANVTKQHFAPIFGADRAPGANR